MATSNADDAEWQVLRFQPWNSAPDVTFWQKLATLKLNTFQLSDQAQVRCPAVHSACAEHGLICWRAF